MSKKTFCLLAIIIFCSTVRAQIKYENGYFIDQDGKKTECLIRNVDWKNNPNSFNYKTSENGKVEKGVLSNISEFGISGGTKYIGVSIEMDKSSEITTNLDYRKQPIFNKEELFLKVLVEGNANLYAFNQGNLRRFFIQKNNDDISQLIYKKYISENNEIKENIAFRQQLANALLCENISVNAVSKTNYTAKALMRLVQNYNRCMDSGYVINKRQSRKADFNLWLRPSVGYNALSISNEVVSEYAFDFPQAVGFRLGAEFEFVLPYNKNKWSLFVEPTYQTYASNREVEVVRNFSENDTFNASVNYNSIELPVGVRYSFFFNDKSKLFVDAAFINDFPVNSKIVVERTEDLIIDSNENFAFGVGYALNNKLHCQLRYQFFRNILDNYTFWSTDFKSVNFILGYNLF